MCVLQYLWAKVKLLGFHCVIVLPLYSLFFFDCLSYATVLFMSKLRHISDGPSLSLLLANLALVPSPANERCFVPPSK